MKTLINEQIVIDFYIGLVNKDVFDFLKGKSIKEEVKYALRELRKSSDLNKKIDNAKKLWKKLFEASMSFIDTNKRGYDKLFRYFDEYVKFEELIFASDSFYRDHTLHSIWVYLLGEYLVYSKQFGIFEDHYHFFDNCAYIEQMLNKIDDINNAKKFNDLSQNRIMQDSLRCISALTHDLGYPLKKIEKINESIKKIMPYFSINRFNDFYFNFEGLHQSFIISFLEALSVNIKITVGDTEVDEIMSRIFEHKVIENKYILKSINNNTLIELSDDEKDRIKKHIGPLIKIESDIEKRLRFSFDLEQYEHGIMSALLLVKTVDCFRKFSLNNFNNRETSDISYAYDPKLEILTAIANHTSKGFQIKGLHNLSEYLLLIDEIEEFSRISRADQNRAFISEFCKTNMGLADDGYFEVEFIFDKSIISIIDTERYFKDKSLKLMRIFDIEKLNTNLCFRLICLDTDNGDINNTYILEIKRNHICLIINDNHQNISSYLKSNEFK